MDTRPLFIPVILGTVRKGRASENVAKFVFSEVQKREGVETELIDIRNLNLPVDDAGDLLLVGQAQGLTAGRDLSARGVGVLLAEGVHKGGHRLGRAGAARSHVGRGAAPR